MLAPINFKKWIDDHRHLLKPPIGNQQVYLDNKDFIVMVVGGPNNRKDFHYNEGEEFFYQLEGDIIVRVVVDDMIQDVPIKEGDIFLLPPRTPHSPQRPANTIGLVMERHRTSAEKDGFLWYCESCGAKLYEEYVVLENIVTQLPVILNTFYSNIALRTCKKCGTIMESPVKK